MSNTQNKIIYYDPAADQFSNAAHAKFHKLFKEYRYPSPEQIQQLSEETGAPLRRCTVCSTACIDLS